MSMPGLAGVEGRTFLVTGGSASGKSDFAQRLARHLGEPVTYLATGKAEGPEMTWRVNKHRNSRPAGWCTVEAPRDLARALDTAADPAPVVLLEDLGSLAAACLPHVDEQGGELALPQSAIEQAQAALDDEIDSVLRWCAERRKALVVVTLEVGLGLLPLSPLSRLYKDVIGHANQRLATQVDRTFLVVAGLPVDLTALSTATHGALELRPTAQSPGAPTPLP